jgi:hypothetical protein
VGFTEVCNLIRSSFRTHPSLFPQSVAWSLSDTTKNVQADGTLQAQDKVIKESDLVILLISDAAQANDYKKKIGDAAFSTGAQL